nr:membrane protein insertion efficiency factor YidD [Candidatus Enterousia merdequi]
MKNNLTLLSRIGIKMVRFYQYGISPFIGGKCACRFSPTCSEYTKQAIEKYGFFHGSFLGMKRILRCHPHGEYGYDPVP